MKWTFMGRKKSVNVQIHIYGVYLVMHTTVTKKQYFGKNYKRGVKLVIIIANKLIFWHWKDVIKKKEKWVAAK